MGDLVDATYLELEFDVIECTVLSLIRDVTFFLLLPLESQPPLWLIEKLSWNSSIFGLVKTKGSVTMRVTPL